VRDALAEFEPAGYLAAFPFYSDSDRRFRFVRDRVLGPAGYREVMDAMLDAAGLDLDAFCADLWLSAEQVRRLDDQGHVVGLHSHSHPTDLAAMTPQAQRAEYRRNLAVLTDVLGAPPETVSHPCNSYNDQTLAILTELGVSLGFRANMARAREPHGPLEWPREDHANVAARMRKART
jgi:peptidoglycan/xylan/chitin deacetylase (PgdA/CDA1 family)